MIKQKNTFRNETEKTIKSLIITLGLMIAVLSIVFISLTSRNSQLGYTLEQEKLRNEQLKSESAGLKAKITDANTFGKIINDKVTEQMNTPENQTFVTDEDNRVK